MAAEETVEGAGKEDEDTLAGGNAEDTVTGEDTQASEETVEGGAGNDTVSGGDGNDSLEGEVTVQIGNEKPPAEEKAPGWVREVRQKNRELAKENAELRKKMDGQQTVAVGKEPTLEEFDYDADKFKSAYATWLQKKSKADADAAKVVEVQKADQVAWQGKLDAYGTAKAAIKVPDIDEAEALVQETLSEKQQAIILKGAKNPALLVYALGKNPAKVKELAGLTDLVEFAFAVANVESQLKITKKPAPPAPEKKVEGTGAKSGSIDSTLDRLRADAEKTGDYSKVHAHKNKKAA